MSTIFIYVKKASVRFLLIPNDLQASVHGRGLQRADTQMLKKTGSGLNASLRPLEDDRMFKPPIRSEALLKPQAPNRRKRRPAPSHPSNPEPRTLLPPYRNQHRAGHHEAGARKAQGDIFFFEKQPPVNHPDQHAETFDGNHIAGLDH